MKVVLPHRRFLYILCGRYRKQSFHLSPHTVLHLDRGCCGKDLDHFGNISLKNQANTCSATLISDPVGEEEVGLILHTSIPQ